MIEIAQEAQRTSGMDFKKVLRRAVKLLEDKGLYPVPKHGGDPGATPKRLARLKRAIDEEENLALAHALLVANRRRKTGQ